jgi:hypothetical protein
VKCQLTFYNQAAIKSLDLSNARINLEGFHPTIFNIFAQWVGRNTLWPLVHNSISPAPAALYNVLDVTFTTLFDTSNDGNFNTLKTARMFVEAYFMGMKLGAHHFMDAILNLIVRHLHMNSAPLPHHVAQVYARSSAGLTGLKKLLVDAYLWVQRVNSTMVKPLHSYPPAFQADVTATLNATRTRKHTYDVNHPDNPLNREFVDIGIDFARLESCLVNDTQGSLKCRYHMHGANEMCWNLMVDSTPVTAAPRLPVGAHRR